MCSRYKKQPCGFRKAVCYNIRMGSYTATAVAVVILYLAYKGGRVDSLSCVVVGNSRLDSLLCKYGAVELCRRQTVKRFYDRFYGKRSDIEDYRKTNRGGKGVKTMNITDKTGKLVTIKSVTDENDLMIINKSGITIRLKVADVRIMGRATQGVRLINLEKRNDEIGSVCKVTSENEEELIEEGEENTLESEFYLGVF